MTIFGRTPRARVVRFVGAREPQGQHADRGQVRAQPVDEEDIGAIGQRAERGGAEPADAERGHAVRIRRIRAADGRVVQDFCRAHGIGQVRRGFESAARMADEMRRPGEIDNAVVVGAARELARGPEVEPPGRRDLRAWAAIIVVRPSARNDANASVRSASSNDPKSTSQSRILMRHRHRDSGESSAPSSQ